MAVDNYELEGVGRKEAKYASMVDEITLCINTGEAEIRMMPSKKAASRMHFVLSP